MAISQKPLKTVVQVTIEPDGSVSDAWLSSHAVLEDGGKALAETMDTIRLDKVAIAKAMPKVSAMTAMKEATQ